MKMLLASLALACLAVPVVAQNPACHFQQGMDNYLDVPYDPTILPQTGITVEAWVTYDSSTLGAGNRWPTIVRQNPTPQSESYMLRVDAGSTANNNLRWLVRTTNGVVTADWAFAVGALNGWSHVAGTFDGTKLELIVNGNVVSTSNATGNLVDQGGPLRIGNGDLSSPGAEAWAGDVDEVRLWPFARTAAEIQSTMMAQLESVPGLVSTWNLNGNFVDTSGSNTATQIGTVNFIQNGP
ncbi:MAG: LamG domain-containing protein, partial [Planctomycetes bacterium]|nr:LamG domain-containing protein [Planctomycetota bacterium]